MGGRENRNLSWKKNLPQRDKNKPRSSSGSDGERKQKKKSGDLSPWCFLLVLILIDSFMMPITLNH